FEKSKTKASPLHKDITRLSKLMQLVCKKCGSSLDMDAFKSINNFIEVLNRKHFTNLQGISHNEEQSLKRWLVEAKSCWKSLRVIERVEEDKSTQKKIRQAVDRHNHNIVNEFYLPLKEVKGKWYANILEEVSLEEWMIALGKT
ncbi:5030_t:CDS:2, partial [Gigaspora margarita]